MNILILFILLQGTIEQIKSTSLGELEIGSDLEQFLVLTHNNRTIKKEIISLEGDDYDIYNVYQNDRIIFAVEPDCNPSCVVWRIWINSDIFKTEKGIGIHNTLGDIKKHYKIKGFAVGEGRIAILVEDFDYSFLLDSRQIPDDWWGNQSLDKLNNNIRIDQIII